jgi:hypothetical protein
MTQCGNALCPRVDTFVQALFSHPLHSDIIQFKDNIGVILDQGKDSLTGTQPPVVAGVIRIFHLFALGGTVKAHLQSICQKFNVDSRAAAVAVGAQKGLLGE